MPKYQQEKSQEFPSKDKNIESQKSTKQEEFRKEQATKKSPQPEKRPR